ncbi:hypothetical protein ABZ832_23145 [Streptantibioticus parmotrematis]|uniref:hypothetical protein n=1 Tax=Streptantibioticus parmotrematis TaxID=2873249 RepID=UPI00340D8ADB
MDSPTNGQAERPPSRKQTLSKSTVARDVARGRVGKVMDYQHGRYYLRPIGGGREWSAEPRDLVPLPLSEALRDSVAAVTRQHRRGDL